MFGNKPKDEKGRDHYLNSEFFKAIITLAYLLAMEAYAPIYPLNSENTYVFLFVFLFLVEVVCALLLIPWAWGFVGDSYGVSMGPGSAGRNRAPPGPFFISKGNGIPLEKRVARRVFLIIWLLGVLAGVGITGVLVFAIGVPSIDVFTRQMVEMSYVIPIVTGGFAFCFSLMVSIVGKKTIRSAQQQQAIADSGR